MIIDCEDCEMFGTDHCKDCFVMAVLNRRPGAPLVLDAEQENAITHLQDAGLAPILKFRRRAG